MFFVTLGLVPKNDNFVEVIIEKRRKLGWVVDLPDLAPGFRRRLSDLLDDVDPSPEKQVSVSKYILEVGYGLGFDFYQGRSQREILGFPLILSISLCIYRLLYQKWVHLWGFKPGKPL